MIRKIYRWFNRTLYQKKNNNNVVFKSGSHICRGGLLEGNNLIGEESIIDGCLGIGSYIGNNCHIRGNVGRYCSISNNVRVVVGTHPTKKFVSTHPCFYSIREQAGFTYATNNYFDEIKYADDNRHHVLIGNDVWIGEGVIICGGIKIGDGAIIAAGSVVNKDVEPYSIVGGIPAKEIGKRFSDDEIKILLEIRWWDLPTTWIKKNAISFLDIRQFIKLFEIEKKK